LYHALVGSPPFKMGEKGIVDLMQRQISAPPPLPSLLNPELSPEVEAVLLRGLEKDPARRFPSAAAMIRALAEAAHLPLPNHFPLEDQPVTHPSVGRGRLKTVAFAVGTIALLLVLAVALSLLSTSAD